MNVAVVAKSTCRPSKFKERGIVIMELNPQDQPLNQAKAKASDESEDLEIRRKGKKLVKKALVEPSRESTPSPIKRALLEAVGNIG